MTLVDEGLHRYLYQTGRAFEHRPVSFCPVSLREEGDTGSGTRVSAVFVHLGEPQATVVERIGQVVSAMDAAKREMRAMSKDAAMAYAVTALIARLAVLQVTDKGHHVDLRLCREDAVVLRRLSSAGCGGAVIVGLDAAPPRRLVG